jgi:hypothetical protein
MMKSEFVKSNDNLTATILIVLLLLLKVVKRNHRVHLLIQTVQITLKIQSWMKIIQHSISRIWEGLVYLSMSKVFPGCIIVVLNQDIWVNIVNFFKKRFSNQCTQIRLYYRLFQMYTNFFTWWISSLPLLPLWKGAFHIPVYMNLIKIPLSGSEVKIDPKEFGSSYENIHGRKTQTVR